MLIGSAVNSPAMFPALLSYLQRPMTAQVVKSELIIKQLLQTGVEVGRDEF